MFRSCILLACAAILLSSCSRQRRGSPRRGTFNLARIAATQVAQRLHDSHLIDKRTSFCVVHWESDSSASCINYEVRELCNSLTKLGVVPDEVRMDISAEDVAVAPKVRSEVLDAALLKAPPGSVVISYLGFPKDPDSIRAFSDPGGRRIVLIATAESSIPTELTRLVSTGHVYALVCQRPGGMTSYSEFEELREYALDNPLPRDVCKTFFSRVYRVEQAGWVAGRPYDNP